MLLLSIVFLIIRVIPGDPVLLHFERKASEEAVEAMRQRLGLDKSLPIQYFEYLGGLLRGDLGRSMQDFSPVSEQIFSAFPATLELAICSMLVATTVGILLGVKASESYNSLKDHLIRAFGIIVYAMPIFFLGMIFQMIFAINFHWLPANGRFPPRLTEPRGMILFMNEPVGIAVWSFMIGLLCLALHVGVLRMKGVRFRGKGSTISLSHFMIVWIVGFIVWIVGFSYAQLYLSGVARISTGLFTVDSVIEGNILKFVESLRYLFLPSLTLGLVLSGVFIRLTRSNMLETLRLDFVTAAKARGLKESTVTYGYALRNAFLPILTMMGLQFATLLGGAILTETTFSWPGLGRYLVDRINFRDYTAIQGAVVYFALIVAVVNLIVDILYAYLDPRIRY
jgi:ABC-type dipeptide/oligopeptide/nickel transport system permease component